jgi:phosphoenolpyruvate---glycerone phosphotransferase subunit DhaK
MSQARRQQILNRAEDLVDEALEGMAAAFPGRLRVDSERVVVRADAPRQGKVGLVSGGGSGHEPLHAGYVGPGMLDAAVAGQIFSSPPPDHVVAAARAVDGGAGVLLIVKNYTGDVMNFTMAAEELEEDGIEVASVLVKDDVAVEDSTHTAGRRGVAGTVLVEKLAGAAAERGGSLERVKAVAEEAIDRTRSFGVAVGACTPPGGEQLFELPPGEMEVGVGIHGEPGRRRQPIASAAEIAAMMFEAIVEDRPLASGAEVLTLVNGLGSTTLLELFALDREVAALCAGAGLVRSRVLVGNYLTSLDMAGASLTMLELDDALTDLWDAPVETPALRWGG